MPRPVHLICHAHIDPVWLWTWEDGLAETLSTFRVAADFCEEHDAFVFNQNESLLYEWVETHDYTLFKRIRKLIHAGRWHIAGGAFLQPDLNGPGGESHIRQFLLGLRYFSEKFGQRPRVAYNLDSFGHPEGLPQVLAGCGFDAYLFTRPDFGTHDLPTGNFTWRDLSGAAVVARRADEAYVSHPGDERLDLETKIPTALSHYADEPTTLLLWGVGNHGGGASRHEYQQLQKIAADRPDLAFKHSTPEAFFEQAGSGEHFPNVQGEIQHSFPGCYTSMSRVKRVHRRLEGMLGQTERLAALAWWCGRRPYPDKAFAAAWRDVLFCQFHDVLTGTGTPAVEHEALARLGRAELTLRETVIATCLHPTISSRDTTATRRNDHVPIHVFNPHGHRFRGLVELDYTVAHGWIEQGEVCISSGDKTVPHQRVASANNLDTLWTPRVVVAVDLKPFEHCVLAATVTRDKTAKPGPTKLSPDALSFDGPSGRLRISRRTGLVDVLETPDGEPLVRRGAFRPVLFEDFDHSWSCGDPAVLRNAPQKAQQAHAGFRGYPWKKPSARFRLATSKEAHAVAPRAVDRAANRAAPPIRVIEDGPLRRVIEAVFVRGRSSLLRRYVFDLRHGRVFLRDHVHFQHADYMLKLEVPLAFDVHHGISQSLFSVAERKPTRHIEDRPNQRWVSAVNDEDRHVSIVNDGSFGHALSEQALYVNLLRSPPYASFGIKADDPYHGHAARPRQDQGEHEFGFEICWGVRHDAADLSRRADEFQMPPVWRAVYGQPADALTEAWPRLLATPSSVRVVALKRAESRDALVVRLLNTRPRSVRAKLHLDGRIVWAERMPSHALQTVLLQRQDNAVISENTNLVEGD